MSTIYFYGDFKKSKVGTAPSPAPTLDLYKILRSTGVETAVGTGLSMTASTLTGRYVYELTGADLTLYDYHGRAHTSDTSMDNQESDVLWVRYAEAEAAGIAAIGVPPTASAIAAAILAAVVEAAQGSAPAFDVQDVLKQLLAMASGQTRDMTLGPSTGTVKNPGGTKSRAVATLDGVGNRTVLAWDNS